MELKLKNNFKIADFITYTETDFCFSKKSDDEYWLLNEPTYGIVTREHIDSLINDGLKVLVVDEKTMKMEVENIKSNNVYDALIKM